MKNLVYSGSKQNVKMTMINGKVLYEDNHFEIGFDPKEIYQQCECDHRPHEIETLDLQAELLTLRRNEENYAGYFYSSQLFSGRGG